MKSKKLTEIILYEIWFLFLSIEFAVLYSKKRKKKNNPRNFYVFYFIIFCSDFIRRIHESLEESGYRRSFGRGRTIRQVGLGGVARRENDPGHRIGQTGRIQGGHGRRSAVRHARAVATGPAVSARRTVLPAEHDRQGQRDDDIQRH